MLELLPRADQRAYAELLRDHDVGLALMYTPHPSLVPIEMASAGMLVVTNSFENKTRGGDDRDLGEPDRGAAVDRRRRRRAARGRGPGRGLRRRVPAAATCGGAATGTSSFPDELLDRLSAGSGRR